MWTNSTSIFVMGKFSEMRVTLAQRGRVHKHAIISKIKLIDSVRFLSSSLSILADNLSEVLRKVRCKNC